MPLEFSFASGSTFDKTQCETIKSTKNSCRGTGHTHAGMSRRLHSQCTRIYFYCFSCVFGALRFQFRSLKTQFYDYCCRLHRFDDNAIDSGGVPEYIRIATNNEIVKHVNFEVACARALGSYIVSVPLRSATCLTTSFPIWFVPRWFRLWFPSPCVSISPSDTTFVCRKSNDSFRSISDIWQLIFCSCFINSIIFIIHSRSHSHRSIINEMGEW